MLKKKKKENEGAQGENLKDLQRESLKYLTECRYVNAWNKTLQTVYISIKKGKGTLKSSKPNNLPGPYSEIGIVCVPTRQAGETLIPRALGGFPGMAIS